MELELNIEDEARLDLYCDVLLRFMLVGAVMGECDLYRRMGIALDGGDTPSLANAMAQFDALPEELKARVLDGDPTLSTLMEHAGRDDATPPARARPASA
jgi:hypothetical protein